MIALDCVSVVAHSIVSGDIIILLDRRSDQWCKGNLNGHVGLFPGNFVQEI